MRKTVLACAVPATAIKRILLATLLCSYVLLIMSCQPNNRTEFIAAPVSNSIQPGNRGIEIDTIRLDSINTSSFGDSFIFSDRLVFVDKHFCTLSFFNEEGKFLSTKLGQGGGPHETQIGRIAAASKTEDNQLLLFGYNLDFYLYDLKEIKLNKSFILKHAPTKDAELSYLSPFIYTNQYDDMVFRVFDKSVYFNIYAEHPDFNILANPRGFLEQSRHIREVNVKKQTSGRLLAAGYPDSYMKDPSKHVILSGTSFDIDNQGNFYVNYDTDSLIYVYDHDYKPIATFGYQGQEMNTDYLAISSPQESRKNYRSERTNKGYYYWIEYVNETKTLFRSYQKNDSRDGMQIYKDNTLIEDIEVPKGLRVMGYIAPYYYSYIIPKMEEEDNSLIVYRFKLNSTSSNH